MLIMRLCCWNYALPLAVTMALVWPLTMRAQSCTTESEMTPAQRDLYVQAARSLGTEILAGNTAAVQANTVAPVAAQFSAIAESIQQISPLVRNATLTIDALYNLNSLELRSNGGSNSSANQTQFFCSVPNSALLVTVTIPSLPVGNYLLAILHATGVEQPQQVTLLLQNDSHGSSSWKLAGLYVRAMTAAGHGGVWYWKKARDFAANRQNWNAFFYYQTAIFLLNPVDFLSSPNLEKLLKEEQEVMPAGLPGKQSMIVNAGGQSLDVTGLRTDTFSGELDLVVDYQAEGVTDPVSTRAQIVSLMKALLAAHPELRTGFHGLWVYAHYSNGQSFAIELPMNQIE
ncbi:MAG TPA: hypothetical protein VME86_01670 [Acidobacteriaceae bacterium]|nr:hypothetical protein [Acidobacteriaceae bacterium]